MTGLDALAETKDVRLALIYNPTTLTDASFVSAGTDSVVEYDISATAIAGGDRVREFYLADSSNINLVTDLFSEILLSLDALGTTADVFSIAAVRLGSTSVVHASINWKELN